MDLNEYCLHAMTKERIATIRAEVRAAELRAAARRPLRVVVGRLLVRLGTRMLQGFTPARAAA